MSKPTPEVCRNGAISILRKLREAGHETYFAGGCVRDRLLSGSPVEYDIATNATPEDIKKVFPKARSVGEAFGVMLVRRNDVMYDVATFRSDGPYSDHRHPDAVQFSDAKHDAQRRDFTINGMFEDPIEETIIDYVDGQADIDARLIRAIGNPQDRIEEDHLRMLRAVRFAARFSFAIESETADAIRQKSEKLIGVSKERIGEEVKKMLLDEQRGVAAWELQYLGLDRFILGEPSCMNAPTRLGRLFNVTSYATALAAWLIDRHSNQCDEQSIANKWRDQLLLSNKVFEELKETLAIHKKLFDWDQLGTAAQKRIAASPVCDAAMTILHAEDSALFVHIRKAIIEHEKTGLAPGRLINGHDLLDAGLRPSPKLGDVLEAVYDAQLEGSISNRNDALRLAKAIYTEITDTQ